MDAKSVIYQIQTLAPEERAKVLAYLHSLEEPAPTIQTADDAVFEKAARWTFEEHRELMRKLSQ